MHFGMKLRFHSTSCSDPEGHGDHPVPSRVGACKAVTACKPRTCPLRPVCHPGAPDVLLSGLCKVRTARSVVLLLFGAFLQVSTIFAVLDRYISHFPWHRSLSTNTRLNSDKTVKASVILLMLTSIALSLTSLLMKSAHINNFY